MGLSIQKSRNHLDLLDTRLAEVRKRISPALSRPSTSAVSTILRSSSSTSLKAQRPLLRVPLTPRSRQTPNRICRPEAETVSPRRNCRCRPGKSLVPCATSMDYGAPSGQKKAYTKGLAGMPQTPWSRASRAYTRCWNSLTGI